MTSMPIISSGGLPAGHVVTERLSVRADSDIRQRRSLNCPDRIGRRMSSRIVRGLIAVAAVAGAATALTPGIASADGADTNVCWNHDGSRGGCAAITTAGEILHVTDGAADGWGTRAQIQKYQNGLWVNHSSNCFDDTSRGTPETTCNYSIPDGTSIRIHIWASNGNAWAYDNYSPITTA